MAREDWRDERHERDHRWRDARDRDDFGQADYSTDYAYDAHARAGYRADEQIRARGDGYGQADYTTDWGYDPERGGAYRRYADDNRGYDVPREQPRSWMDRAGDFFAGRDRAEARYEDDRRHDGERRARHRSGSSDRVLWAVIMERLHHDRRIDLRDVEVHVINGEVTLHGTVRRKDEKRRIEDIADIDGVRNVQNNLRLRDRGWTFF